MKIPPKPNPPKLEIRIVREGFTKFQFWSLVVLLIVSLLSFEGFIIYQIIK